MKGEKVALAQRAAQYQRADNGCLHTFKDSWVIHESLFLYGIPSIGVVDQFYLVWMFRKIPCHVFLYTPERNQQSGLLKLKKQNKHMICP